MPLIPCLGRSELLYADWCEAGAAVLENRRIVEMQLLTGFEANCSTVRVAAALRRVYARVNKPRGTTAEYHHRVLF